MQWAQFALMTSIVIIGICFPKLNIPSLILLSLLSKHIITSPLWPHVEVMYVTCLLIFPCSSRYHNSCPTQCYLWCHLLMTFILVFILMLPSTSAVYLLIDIFLPFRLLHLHIIHPLHMTCRGIACIVIQYILITLFIYQLLCMMNFIFIMYYSMSYNVYHKSACMRPSDILP